MQGTPSSRTREIGLTTLAMGIILSFGAAIAGATIYLTLQYWQNGEEKRALKTGLIGLMISYLLFLFFQSPLTDISLDSAAYFGLDLIIQYCAGFLGMAFIHNSILNYEKSAEYPFELNWIWLFATYFLGLGLIFVLAFGTLFPLHQIGLCQIPGIRNTYKSSIEFRGLKAGLLQEKDFAQSCNWEWDFTSTSRFALNTNLEDSVESVDHNLTGSYEDTGMIITHSLENSTSKIPSTYLNKYDEFESDFTLDLPDVGNQSYSRCNSHNISKTMSSTRCLIVVQYDYILSDFFIQTFDEISKDELNKIVKQILIETDTRIKAFDRP